MCEPVSIGMAAVALVGGVMAAKGKADAEGNAVDGQRRDAREQVKQMNMANANLNLTAQDNTDEARRQLSEINITALRNKGTVNAAIGESGISGNSMKRIKNITDNEASAARMSVTDNYKRDYQSLFANQIANTENTKSSLRGQAQIIKTSGLSHALDITSSTFNGYAAGSSVAKSGKASASDGTAKGGAKP